jgi:DNA-binding response OmpR family regulator
MRKYRILLVEDDRSTQEMLVQWLQDFNHCPTTATCCGDEALNELNKQSFDLVLTNNMMPGMLGIELATLIRRRGGPPVIMISGFYNREMRFKAFANGAKAYVRKPLDLGWLLELIETVVDQGLHYIGSGPPGGYNKGKDRTYKKC